MSGSGPVRPGWVSVENAFALDDLMALAFGLLAEGEGTDWHRGVALTAAWVRGYPGAAGPVTLRDEQPVSRELAAAERWAAAWVDSDGPRFSLRDDAERIGVAFWEPVTGSRLWARGAEAVLAWLLANPLERRPPPMPVPVRTAEGAVATARELYERARAAASRERWAPEHRREAWTRAEVTEMRSLRLAARVEQSVRWLRVS